MYCRICDKDFSDAEVTKWEDEVYCPDCGHSINITDSRDKAKMDLDSKLIQLARSNYENKSTSELLIKLENSSQDEYFIEVFEAIRQILTERGASLPPQKAQKANSGKSINSRPTYISVLSAIMIILGTIWLLSFGKMIIFPTERDLDLGYLVMTFLSAFVIASGYGLWKLENWARLSTIVILVVLVMFWGIKATGGNIAWGLGYAIGVISLFGHPIFYLSRSDTARLFVKSNSDKKSKAERNDGDDVSYTCSECKAEVSEEDKVCPKCGSDLTVEAKE
jgi:DNA-directed RNA polymerase subunit RPC12/RpoP